MRLFRVPESGIPHGFSTVDAGNMKDDSCGQSAFLRALGAPWRRTHLLPSRDGVPSICMGNESNMERGDGIIVTERQHALTMLPGDCPVVYIAAIPALVMVHGSLDALWKGALQAGLLEMQRLGFAPSQMQALIGPGIRPCCYRFSMNHPQIEVLATRGEWSSAMHTQGGEFVSIDLHAYIVSVLARSGIEKIAWSSVCTCCGRDEQAGGPLFFSHRRSVVEGSQEGRFMAAGWLL